MSTIVSTRPRFREEDAATLARDLYGLEVSVRPLPSERDQNFHLKAGSGDCYVLKIARADERSVYAFMRGMVRQHVLDPTQVETWRRVRNSVMHGELTEPWSTEEGDRHVQELVGLTHALTRLRIARG